MAPTFALAIHDLLVGEHRAQSRAPIHRDLGQIGQPSLIQFPEDPLSPADIARISRVDLTGPIVIIAQGLELASKHIDVLFGCFPRVRSGLDGILLRRQAEGVPPHGMKDVKATHALVSGINVRRDVAFGVPDMKPRP